MSVMQGDLVFNNFKCRDVLEGAHQGARFVHME
jgi:hypothetical protein